MAAGLLTVLGTEKGMHLEARSAGLAHHPKTPVADNAIVVMKELGIDISKEYSKPVTEDAVRWADVVITVQRRHAAHLMEDYPWAETKIRCLERDVRDPYCYPVEEYRIVRDELSQLLALFVASVAFE
jgi:protein-tyrosine-phosphatase